MEFKFNAPSAIGDVMKIDNTLTAEGYEYYIDFQKKMGMIIDEAGKLSAMAQGLKTPVTTARKLANSDHIVYMMIDNHSTSPNFTVVGILKMGWTKMNLCDNTGSRSEAMVNCLLDFYVHETKQRKGYGKRLIDYMLQDMDLDAKNLAIDKPTKKILNFMQKHYQLSKLVSQDNNIAIFEEFFHKTFNEKMSHDNTNIRAMEYKHQPTFGRHGAHKHHDTMGEILQGEGDAASVKFKYNHDTNFVDSQFKEVNPHPDVVGAGVFQTDEFGNCVKRDIKFHHSAIW